MAEVVHVAFHFGEANAHLQGAHVQQSFAVLQVFHHGLQKPVKCNTSYIKYYPYKDSCDLLVFVFAVVAHFQSCVAQVRERIGQVLAVSQ